MGRGWLPLKSGSLSAHSTLRTLMLRLSFRAHGLLTSTAVSAVLVTWAAGRGLKTH